MPIDFLRESENFKSGSSLVFPDNMLAATVFSDMMTQWRVGFNGITGLDYVALPIVLDYNGVVDFEIKKDVFQCVKIMEGAVLKKLSEK